MVAPALIFVALATQIGPVGLRRGWAIPCATDIAFSAMVARIIFRGPSGDSLPLLLAIADDALGLIILAVFYPSGTLSFGALGSLMSAALALAWWLRRRRTSGLWPYVVGPGALSWAALYWGGFHPALALVPIVPFMPHSARDLGLFDPRRRPKRTRSAASNTGGRGRCRSSCCFRTDECRSAVRQIGNGTYYVLAALCSASRWGSSCSRTRARFAGARLPDGLRLADLVVVGMAAAIGFTVALFSRPRPFRRSAARGNEDGRPPQLRRTPLALSLSRLLRGRTA